MRLKPLFSPILSTSLQKRLLLNNFSPGKDFLVLFSFSQSGDKLRIDFLFESKENSGEFIGLEVKYLKEEEQDLNLENDYTKLISLDNFLKAKSLKKLILVAGRLSANQANSILTQNLEFIENDEFCTHLFFTSQFKREYGVVVFEVT